MTHSHSSIDGHSHTGKGARPRSLLQRWVPHPILSLVMVLLWLSLNNSVAPGHIVLAVVMACVLPIQTAHFWPDRPRLRSPFTVLVFLLIFVWDVIVANLQVAYLVVFYSPSQIKSQWISVPLDLRQPEAITMLAGTISLTPGTISSDLSADGRSLLVHCLHVEDPEAEVQKIKVRYEQRLKAIFP